jgi:hypothetical protein
VSAPPSTRSASTVRVGEKLERLEIHLTPTLIIAGAIASRDFYPGHHDRGVAQSLGMKDIFMNIHTTNGLVTRYVTDWAGPEAIVRHLQLRLGAPNYPGDIMRISGVVTRAEGASVSVDVAALNGLGTHCEATFTLELAAT